MFSFFRSIPKKESLWTEDAIGFEDVQYVVKEIMNDKKALGRSSEEEIQKMILITTIPSEFVPSCATFGWKEGDNLPLIRGTLDAEEEEDIINSMLIMNESLEETLIVVYGKNALDESVMKKVKELRDFGFENVYGYIGGMFEWCLLSDIYGEKEFPFVGSMKKVYPLFYKVERSLDI